MKNKSFGSLLTSTPLWYLDPFYLEIEKFLQIPKDKQLKDWKEKKDEIINTLSDLLEKNQVILGNEPEGFNDDDRAPIDTIVIHHTHTDPNTSYGYINALQLIRLYVPVFRLDPFKKNGEYQPISSGHFLNGKQTFVGYHYLVRVGGNIEQILKDKYTGFHAGDYKTNCRSIGIAIVGDLTEKPPSKEALKSVKKLIQKYSPNVILGHGEVIKTNGQKVKTECPGKSFYGAGINEKGWKTSLLEK